MARPGPRSACTGDPLGTGVTTGVTGGFTPAYNNVETNNARPAKTRSLERSLAIPLSAAVVHDRY